MTRKELRDLFIKGRFNTKKNNKIYCYHLFGEIVSCVVHEKRGKYRNDYHTIERKDIPLNKFLKERGIVMEG